MKEDDLENKAWWLIQHGYLDGEFDEVINYLKRINKDTDRDASTSIGSNANKEHQP